MELCVLVIVIASVGIDLHVGETGKVLLIALAEIVTDSISGVHIVFLRLPIISISYDQLWKVP